MSLADIIEYLRSTDPGTWKQWVTSAQALAGGTVAKIFRASGFDVTRVRTAEFPGRPARYRLDQVVKAVL
ncbi:hypothetical protein [Streptomyces iconiensis]|uniref:Uncharacterized protein n=1 Tax=Streptomyces iconiensis TaxID=1384038 RepID=A0ABT7A780_9ACTN|nr:hypothetical protein [Streptomyces iconiensis]MDJ1136869.1 hypothetical protein [Streptomyces iconiensis]